MLKNELDNTNTSNYSYLKGSFMTTSAVVLGVMLVTSMILSPSSERVMLQSAYAASDPTVAVGDGPGSIVYRVHKIPGNWDPCFAINCETASGSGTGPGTSMYFEVFDSSLNRIGGG